MDATESQDALLAKDRQIAVLGEALKDRTALVDRQIAMIAHLRYKLALQGFLLEKPEVKEEGETLSQVQRERQRLLEKVAELTTQLQDTEANAEKSEALRHELEAAHANLRQQILDEVAGPQFSQQLLSQQLVEEVSQPSTEFYQLEIQRLKQQLSSSDAENHAYLGQVKTQCGQIEELHRRLQQSQATAERMVAHYQEMEAVHAATTARMGEFEEYKARYEEAAAELARLQDSVHAERRMSDTRDKLLTEDLETANEQLKECQRRFEEKAIALEGTLEDLNRVANENEAFKLQLAELRGQIMELTTAASQLSSLLTAPPPGRSPLLATFLVNVAEIKMIDIASAEERNRQAIAEAEDDSFVVILHLEETIRTSLPSQDTDASAICHLLDALCPGHELSAGAGWEEIVSAVQARFQEEQQRQCIAALEAAAGNAKEELQYREQEFASERKAWREKVELLQAEVASRESAAAGIESELAEIRNHIASSEEKYEKLVAAHAEATKERDRLEAALSTAERSHAEKLQLLNDGSSSLQQQLEAAETKLAESARLNEDLRTQVATLEQRLATTKLAQPDTPKRTRQQDVAELTPNAGESSPAKKPRVSPAVTTRQSVSPTTHQQLSTPITDGVVQTPPAAAVCSPLAGRALNQKPVVMLSGFKDGVPGNKYTNAAKAEAARVVAALYGTVSLEHADRFDVRVTHVVSPPSARTLKTLAAAVTGKWIVGISWIHESQRANMWVNEAPHGRKGDGERLCNRRVFCSSQFQDGADKANRMHHAKQLVETYGRGHIVNDVQTADIVFVGSRENRVPYGDRHCLTWEEFIEFIYPKAAA